MTHRVEIARHREQFDGPALRARIAGTTRLLLALLERRNLLRLRPESAVLNYVEHWPAHFLGEHLAELP